MWPTSYNLVGIEVIDEKSITEERSLPIYLGTYNVWEL